MNRLTALLLALLAGTAALKAQEAAEPVRGAVTNLPLPRYVSLKTDEGNARRGPGLTHRIDWVFKRAGMPLRITAEYENWRRVEDVEGAGGWMHYSLLSGSRTALIDVALLDLRSQPQVDAEVILQAEAGVVARLLECQPEWCRMGIEGEKGWAPKSALWGVERDEIL
jgi:SH3-like domain-containing protein